MNQIVDQGTAAKTTKATLQSVRLEPISESLAKQLLSTANREEPLQDNDNSIQHQSHRHLTVHETESVFILDIQTKPSVILGRMIPQLKHKNIARKVTQVVVEEKNSNHQVYLQPPPNRSPSQVPPDLYVNGQQVSSCWTLETATKEAQARASSPPKLELHDGDVISLGKPSQSLDKNDSTKHTVTDCSYLVKFVSSDSIKINSTTDENIQNNETAAQGSNLDSFQSLAEELMCPLCLDILVQATTLVPCGHSVCGPCWEQQLQQNQKQRLPRSKCACCQTDVTTACASHTLQQTIDRLVGLGNVFSPDDTTYYQSRLEKTRQSASSTFANAKTPSRKRMRRSAVASSAAGVAGVVNHLMHASPDRSRHARSSRRRAAANNSGTTPLNSQSSRQRSGETIEKAIVIE